MYISRFFVSILLVFSLFACSDKLDDSTPAQAQIDEYSARLKKCQEELEKTKASAKEQQATTDGNALDTKENTKVQEDLNVDIVTPPASTQPTNNDAVNGETNTQPANTDDAIPSEKITGDVQPQEASKQNPALDKNSIFNVTDNDMILGGDRNSKVILIEYFAPTCPHCAYYKKEILPKIKEKYVDTNKILYVVREFIANKQDLDAALLARCNNNQESFFKFIDVLLERQDSWSVNKNYREILTNIGQLGGVSAERYAECLNNEKLADIVITNTKLVSSAPRFSGTPAFFINGVQFMKAYSADSLFEAIDEALK